MKIYQVDAFTQKPFMGNPAGVCFTDTPLDEEFMQNLAMEMNLSETAFLVRQGEGYSLRWFTPKSEVSLCGHATLASAHILYETGLLAFDQRALFYTLSGTLYAFRQGDLLTLDFPAKEDSPIVLPDRLEEALGAKAVYCGKNKMNIIVELESEQAIYDLKPDFNLLLNYSDVRAVMVTAKGSGRYDFISRFFAPAVGVNEDPVTGSAHCCLVPYWRRKLNKDTFTAYQASPRGGELLLAQKGDRVFISGKAVTVFICEVAGV